MKKIKLASMLILIAVMACLAVPNTAHAATTLKAPTIKITDKTTHPAISWKKVKGAAGYRVYRKTSADESWVKLADTKKLYYYDLAVTGYENEKVKYCVKAYAKDSKGKKTWSKKSSTKTWTIPVWYYPPQDVYEILGKFMLENGNEKGNLYNYVFSEETYSCSVGLQPGSMLYFSYTDLEKNIFTDLCFMADGEVVIGVGFYNDVVNDDNYKSIVAFNIDPLTYSRDSIIPAEYTYINDDKTRNEAEDVAEAEVMAEYLMERSVKPLLSEYFGIKMHNIGFFTWGD